MADKAAAVFTKAEQDLLGGRYDDALVGYLRVIQGVPDFLRARFRVADCLLNVKARAQALDVYKALVWHYAKAGFPLQSLVALKMVLAMEPTYSDALYVLAELYSKASDRVGPSDVAPPARVLGDKDEAALPSAARGQALYSAVAQAAAATDAIAAYPDQLPQIPLFSFLDEDAFLSVLAGLQLRRYVVGNQVIKEGEPGDSFFILAEGDVRVHRKGPAGDATIAQLHPGSVFGEMALISKAPRTATVTAMNDVDLLELKRGALESAADKLATVTEALKQFTHERFLNNLTGTNPIFQPFPRSVRLEVIKRFQDFPIDPGDELIGEGEEGQGLFLILKGQVEVTKQGGDGQPISLAKLKEGDVFGEIALIQDSPTTATCTATTRGECLFLPRREFKSILAHHPEMLGPLSQITAERIKATKAALTAAPSDDFEIIEADDLVLI